MSVALVGIGPPSKSPPFVYPHSGQCAWCQRERDDLFWHAQDRKFYCAAVFRCEARYEIQARRDQA